jgi:hypothetical protein
MPQDWATADERDRMREELLRTKEGVIRDLL